MSVYSSICELLKRTAPGGSPYHALKKFEPSSRYFWAKVFKLAVTSADRENGVPASLLIFLRTDFDGTYVSAPYIRWPSD